MQLGKSGSLFKMAREALRRLRMLRPPEGMENDEMVQHPDRDAPLVALELENLTKTYEGGSRLALDKLSLSVREGELVALVGPSGCGKTTTLRIVAGLLQPSSGTVRLKNRVINRIPAHKRNIGLVFQNYALFPHLTVEENLAYGLRERRVPKYEIAERVNEVLDMVRLRGLQRRRPRELSGGQQQRVALGRSLAISPDLLLLDEPLSNLDAKLRHEVRTEIRRLQKQFHISTVFVTHDQEEALSIAHRVVVMNDGRIVQIGSPRDIYDQPQTRFVAEFIGTCNLVEATVASHMSDQATLCRITGSTIELPISRISSDPGSNVLLVARPERLSLRPSHASNAGEWIGTVQDITFLGPTTTYEVQTGLTNRIKITTVTGRDETFSVGSRVSITWNQGAWSAVQQN